MKLWLLIRRGERDPWRAHSVNGFVIRAADEDAARRLASDTCGGEGPGVWLDQAVTACTKLTPSGEEGIILGDFAAA